MYTSYTRSHNSSDEKLILTIKIKIYSITRNSVNCCCDESRKDWLCPPREDMLNNAFFARHIPLFLERRVNIQNESYFRWRRIDFRWLHRLTLARIHRVSLRNILKLKSTHAYLYTPLEHDEISKVREVCATRRVRRLS